MSEPEMTSRLSEPSELVDLARYPIDDLDSPKAQRLIADCRAALEAESCCVLPGFVTPKATAAMGAEANALAPLAYHLGGRVNAYRTEDDPSFPPDHPRRIFFKSCEGNVAYDQIPDEVSIKRLYRWEAMPRFLAAVFGYEALYRFEDPFQAINILSWGEGDDLAWHFDMNEFTVTLLFQEPEGGGDFEFVPHIRSRSDENYDAVT
ncbi:MAG: hypothetical protein V3V17_06860, partial [Alphaproteobacteria bacterium]